MSMSLFEQYVRAAGNERMCANKKSGAISVPRTVLGNLNLNSVQPKTAKVCQGVKEPLATFAVTNLCSKENVTAQKRSPGLSHVEKVVQKQAENATSSQLLGQKVNDDLCSSKTSEFSVEGNFEKHDDGDASFTNGSGEESDDEESEEEHDRVTSQKMKEWLMKDVFPDDFEYAGLSVLKSPTNDSNYGVEVHLNLISKEDTEKWVRAFEQKSGNDFRVRKTFPNMSKKRAHFKITYRCHHNTMAGASCSKTKKAHYKNVDCPFSMTITLKNTNMRRSSDKFLKSHQCIVTMQNVLHNHPIRASDALRHRRPLAEVTEKFINFFNNGHSPSSALNTHKHDLQEEFGSDYISVAADGSLCPSLKWCFYQYHKLFSKVYGPQDGEKMIESLEKFIEEYNKECGTECSKMKTTANGQYIIVICTPLMKRVHEFIKGSGEIAFVDSSGSMDRHASRVFMIMTPSVAGALPLGIVITSSESEVILTEAFQLWISILPEMAFHNNKSKGPSVIITDDCAPERNTLKGLFPDALMLLCIFHVLQFVWKWILDSNHKIEKVDKPILYDLFKQILNAQTKEELLANYEELKSHPVTKKYSNANTYFAKLMLRASEWALCYRSEVLTRGHNTNNYCEATMRVLKDQIFFRTKAFSLVQLFHFLTSRVDKYFERRIVAVLNNRVENHVKSRYHIKEEKLIPLSCSKISECIYSVHNSDSKMTYTVNMDVELCTCFVGKNGAPCKHQYCVVKQFNLSSSQFLPFADEEAKRVLFKIICDSSTDLPSEWFSTLRSGFVHPLNETAVTHQEHQLDTGDKSCENVDHSSTANDATCSELSGHVDTSEYAESIENCKNGIDEVAEHLKQKLQESPDTFVSAVEMFLKRFKMECLNRDNACVSALHTFNRHSSPGVRPCPTIPKQPTSYSRRKYNLGGARNPCITGRPPKRLRIATEHGYNAVPKKPFQANLHSTKTPHNISQRVHVYACGKK